MKKINIRSPYFIVIDEAGQTTSKIEIYLWNKGNPTPTIPQYTLSKKAVSTMQTSMHYNVSNYAKEYINPIAPTLVTVPTEEDVNTWCYMQVIGYSDDVAVFDEIFICLNGFNNYSGGYNQSTTNVVVPLVNEDIEVYKTNANTYINVYIESTASYVYTNNNGDYDIDNISPSVWKLPLINGANLLNNGTTIEFTINVQEICEPKYTPMTCYFINRYGGWQPITFFKAKINTFEGKSESYNLLPSSIDYNPLQGQKRVFNNDLKQKVKCNTGFVPENYSELIQDLMVSEVILLDNKPVNIITSSFEEKTSLKDKNINYEIEFEYSYNLINDVV